jgi:serine/threonine protein kinase/WD40 repeat protein/Tfp pilus assembly protein PilF
MSSSDSNSGLVMELAEEFLERYRKGERPPLKEYIDRHPELAAEIREVFPAMAMMENIAIADESLEGKKPSARSQSPDTALRQLGDFRIIREVGKGGMGIVYEAEQVSLGRHVALKVLPKNLLLDDKAKRRFEREAKSAARLHHTNIVPVFGVGEQDGMPYYVMQFIQGLGLDVVLEELKKLQPNMGGPIARPTGEAVGRPDPLPPRELSAANVARSLLTGAFDGTGDFHSDQGPLLLPECLAGVKDEGTDPPRTPVSSGSFTLSSSSVVLPGGGRDGSKSKNKNKKQTYWQSVASLGAQVADALEYAHKQGIHHRDIKPSNLLLDTQGTVWVADFGLAKADDHQNLTHTGDIMGTLRYMPPEAFDGKADGRGDIYSLGLTLYEMLAFRPAFDEKDRHRLIKQVTNDEPERLGRLNRQIPRDLETVLHKAIERDVAHRYQTAGAFAADLQRFVEDEPILARRLTQRERFVRWARRHKGLAASLAVILVLLAAVATVSSIAAIRFQEDATRNANLANEKAVALGEAMQATRDADEARQRAETAHEKTEASLYAAQVSLAESSLKAADAAIAEQVLARCIPTGTGRDRRGWEWYYLDQWLHAERQVWNQHFAYRIVFSPDGRLLASAGGGNPYFKNPRGVVEAGEVLLRELPAGTLRHKLGGHRHLVDLLAFDATGNLLATIGYDRQVILWDTSTGKQTSTFTSPGDLIGIQFVAGGKQLACRGADAVYFVAVESGKVVRTIAGAEPVLSGDGRFLAVSKANNVAIHDVGSGQLIRLAPGRGKVFTADGSRLCVTDPKNGALHLVEIATGQDRDVLPANASPDESVLIDPVDHYLVHVKGETGLAIWDLQQRAFVRHFELPYHRTPLYYDSRYRLGAQIAFSTDGSLLAVGCKDYSVRVYEVATGNERAICLGHQNSITGVAFVPRAQTLVTACFSGDIRLWDPTRNPRGAGFSVNGGADSFASLALSPDGTIVYIVDRAGQIIAWDVLTGQQIASKAVAVTRGANWPRSDFAFSPDCRHLAAPTEKDRTAVGRFDVATGALVWAGQGDSAEVTAVAFSPDGRLLASGGGTGKPGSAQIRIWDVLTGKNVAKLSCGMAGSISALAFSPDGRLLAVAGTTTPGVEAPGRRIMTGGMVALLDTQTGQQKRQWKDVTSIKYLAFRPDGSQLAAADFGAGAIHVWDPATGAKHFTLPGVATASCVAYNPDGDRLAAIGYPGQVQMWDADSGQATLVMRPFAPPAGSIGFTPRLAFSSDGSRIVGNSAHGILSVWDAGADAIPSLRAVARALRTSPDDLALLNKRADLYLKAGRWDKVLAEASRVLQKDPNNARAWGYIAEANLGLGQVDEASLNLKRAQQLAQEDPRLLPVTARVLHQYGKSLVRAGKHELAQTEWQRARACYEQLLRLEPDRGDYTGQYAELLLATTDTWTVLHPSAMKSANGATLSRLADGSILASGNNPDRDTYTLTIPADQKQITAFKLEVLPHESLPQGGPGRAPSGNFLLQEFEVEGAGKPLSWSRAAASFNQDNFPVSNAIDGNPSSGWGIYPQAGRAHYAVFALNKPLGPTSKTDWIVKLHCNSSEYSQHTIGRFRLLATSNPEPIRTDQLRLALAANPDQGWLNLAAVHALRRERDAALAALHKTKAKPADDLPARELILRGSVHLALGQAAKAKPYLEKFSAWMEEHDPEDALLPLIADAFSAPPQTPRGQKMRVQQAQALARLGRVEEAIAGYGKAIAESNDDLRLFVARGNLYAQARKWSEAIADYSRALGPDTKDADLLAKRAEAYYQLKDWGKSAADWTLALKRKPNEIYYLEHRGNCYQWHLNQWDKALADWTSLVKLNPNNPWWWANRAIALDMLKRPDEALADINKISKLLSENDRWLYLHWRGQHWARRGQWAKAAQDSAGVDLARLDGWGWSDTREHALVRLLGGDLTGYHKAATRLFERLGGNPNNDEAFWLARVLLLDPAPPGEAKLKRLQEFVAKTDAYHKPRLTGVVRFRAGRFKEALTLLGDSEGHPDYQYAAAMAHQKLGQSDEARALLDKANRWMDKQQAAASEGGVPESIWWGEWACLLAWRHEAEALFANSPPPVKERTSIKGSR